MHAQALSHTFAFPASSTPPETLLSRCAGRGSVTIGCCSSVRRFQVRQESNAFGTDGHSAHWRTRQNRPCPRANITSVALSPAATAFRPPATSRRETRRSTAGDLSVAAGWRKRRSQAASCPRQLPALTANLNRQLLLIQPVGQSGHAAYLASLVLDEHTIQLRRRSGRAPYRNPHWPWQGPAEWPAGYPPAAQRLVRRPIPPGIFRWRFPRFLPRSALPRKLNNAQSASLPQQADPDEAQFASSHQASNLPAHRRR